MYSVAILIVSTAKISSVSIIIKMAKIQSMRGSFNW